MPRGRLATLALEEVLRLGPEMQRDALIGLLAHVVPDGAQDSQQAWRPEVSHRQLAGPLGRLLQAAEAQAEPARRVAEQIVDAPGFDESARRGLAALLRPGDRIGTTKPFILVKSVC